MQTVHPNLSLSAHQTDTRLSCTIQILVAFICFYTIKLCTKQPRFPATLRYHIYHSFRQETLIELCVSMPTSFFKPIYFANMTTITGFSCLFKDHLCEEKTKQNSLQYIPMLLPVAYVSKLTLGLPAILISQLIKPKVYQYQSFWCVFEGQNMNNFRPDCLEVPKTEWFKPRDIFSALFKKNLQNSSSSYFLG